MRDDSWNIIEKTLQLPGGVNLTIKPQETTPISMGARIYLPGIGRFTQVDPVEGGTENNYVYPADPVNEFDLDGMANWRKWSRDRWRNVKNVAKKVVKTYKNYYSKPENIIGLLVGGRSIRSAKTPRVTERVGNSKYTRTTWTVNARTAGGAARAVMVKFKNEFGKTIRVYKDTYDVNNKFWHRKFKL